MLQAYLDGFKAAAGFIGFATGFMLVVLLATIVSYVFYSIWN